MSAANRINIARLDFTNALQYGNTIVLLKGIVMSVSIVKETTSVKLDKSAKEEAKLIFKQLGLTMGEAFNLFLYQVSLNKGLPFEVKIPNEVTQKVIKDARLGENIDDFTISDLK